MPAAIASVVSAPSRMRSLRTSSSSSCSVLRASVVGVGHRFSVHRAIMTPPDHRRASAGRKALAGSLPAVHLAVHLLAASGARDVSSGVGRVHGMDIVEFTFDVTPGTVPGQAGVLTLPTVNEIERNDRRHDSTGAHRMTRLTRARWAVALVLAFGLVAAACGGRDDKQWERQWNVLDDEAGAAARSGDARRLRLDVPAGVRRDGDRGVQDGAAGGHGDLRAAAARARARPTCRPASSSGPGSDSTVKPEDMPKYKGPFLYFPTVAAPITVSYNLSGVKAPALGRHARQDLPGQDHEVERRGDQGRQPEGRPAVHRDHRRAPLRRLGHHGELHHVPDEGGARRRGRSAPTRPSPGRPASRRATATPASPRSSRAPTARSATSTSRTPRRPASSFAAIKNAAGKYVAAVARRRHRGAGGRDGRTPTSRTTR